MNFKSYADLVSFFWKNSAYSAWNEGLVCYKFKVPSRMHWLRSFACVVAYRVDLQQHSYHTVRCLRLQLTLIEESLRRYATWGIPYKIDNRFQRSLLLPWRYRYVLFCTYITIVEWWKWFFDTLKLLLFWWFLVKTPDDITGPSTADQLDQLLTTRWFFENWPRNVRITNNN